MIACPPSDLPPPLRVSPPATAETETESVVDWGSFKGAIPNAHEKTMMRLQPLRGYKLWTVSNPSNEFISVIFDSKENTENTAVVQRSIAMTSMDGKAYKLEAKTPVPVKRAPPVSPSCNFGRFAQAGQ